MFTGSEIVEILQEMEATHVVALPDSTLGMWEDDLRAAGSPKLVRVCRRRSVGDRRGALLGGRPADRDDPMHGAV
jgi:hypothetical protein